MIRTSDMLNWVRPNIRNLKPYSSARSEFKGQADIFLDANENPFETGMNRYPDPLQWAVKNKIANLKNIPAEHIFLGNGSDEVIDLLIRIFCEPGQEAIMVLPPTYGMYQVSADISNVAVKKVSLSSDFQPDVDAILSEADEKTKLLFLCSPNNPTGNNMDSGQIQYLIDHFEGIVVIDEAYIDFSNQASWVSAVQTYSNVVVMQTFSKAWGLAGIRLGMAFTSTDIIALLNKVKPPYNVNQLSQEAALKALDNHKEVERTIQTIIQERQRITIALEALDFVQECIPSQANFILVRLEDPRRVYTYLLEEKIIVRDRSQVHLCAGALRITIGRPEENDQLLDRLRRFS
ncbi:MAG: histidinol-phosphate transaminase [Saprospiraceae bacterium]|nr:histidinol-phosphate transaminase [Saprospiraceae bacterium]